MTHKPVNQVKIKMAPYKQNDYIVKDVQNETIPVTARDTSPHPSILSALPFGLSSGCFCVCFLMGSSFVKRVN